MGNSYPVELAPVPLTEAGIDRYRRLNERDEGELQQLRDSRRAYEAEIASIDDVMRHLEATIAHRQKRMRGDVIGLTGHGDGFGALESGVIVPTAVHGRGSFSETEPDGYCIHCNQPAWRVSVTPASPKGARHSYGATCNPDDPASGVAELDEYRGES